MPHGIPSRSLAPINLVRGITVLVTGYFSMSRVPFSPTMASADRGHVVNTGSTSGHLVYPRGNVYSTTKFAQMNAYVPPKEES